MRSRPVNPRASLIALIVASVPLDTNRTISTDGTASMTFYLSDDYGGAYLKADLNGRVLHLYGRGG